MSGRPEHTRASADHWFWPKVDRTGGLDACWPWRGRTEKGYGRIWQGGVQRRAHTVAFWLAHGHYPRMGCHTCNNRACCNVRHVYAGTSLSNTRDRQAAGVSTGLMGLDNHNAKLTAAAVHLIRTAPWRYGTRRDLARQYGVTPQAIGMVRARRTYRTSPHPGDPNQKPPAYSISPVRRDRQPTPTR